MPRTEATAQYCIRCGIPRQAYDIKIEPGTGNPDYKMGDCIYGHLWEYQHRTEVLTRMGRGK